MMSIQVEAPGVTVKRTVVLLGNVPASVVADARSSTTSYACTATRLDRSAASARVMFVAVTGPSFRTCPSATVTRRTDDEAAGARGRGGLAVDRDILARVGGCARAPAAYPALRPQFRRPGRPICPDPAAGALPVRGPGTPG